MNKSSVSCTNVYVFSVSVLCLGKVNENPKSNIAWEDRLKCKSSPEYRTLDRIDGEPMEFEWNIFPGFNTLQLSQEVQELLLTLNVTPEIFLMDGLSSCRCSTTSHGDLKTIKKNASQVLNLVFLRKEIWSRTMVIPWTWIRKEVVLY